MEIYQTTRPYAKMRNNYVGDYLYHPGADLFRFMIADMPSDYQALVFLHEFIEAYVCWKEGIKEEDIAAFDKAFEESGKDGEPGDQKDAPYYKQHQIATVFEMIFAEKLGVRWEDYENHINSLGE